MLLVKCLSCWKLLIPPNIIPSFSILSSSATVQYITIIIVLFLHKLYIFFRHSNAYGWLHTWHSCWGPESEFFDVNPTLKCLFASVNWEINSCKCLQQQGYFVMLMNIFCCRYRPLENSYFYLFILQYTDQCFVWLL